MMWRAAAWLGGCCWNGWKYAKTTGIEAGAAVAGAEAVANPIAGLPLDVAPA